MKRNSSPTQTVLFATVDGLVAVNTPITTTIPNQKIGIYSANTNLALNAASPVQPFKIVQGAPNDDAINDVSVITQSDMLLKGFQFQCYQDAQSAVVGVKFTEDSKIYCNQKYVLRLRVESHRIRQFYGLNVTNETFVVKPECCIKDCEDATCVQTTLLNLIKEFITKINASPSSDFTAQAYNPLTGAVIADVDAFWAANTTANADGILELDAGVELGILITARDAQFKSRYGEYDYDWAPFSSTEMIVSLVDGFDCGVGEVVVEEEVVYEQGTSKQVAKEELYAMGDTLQTPYRYLHGRHTVPYGGNDRSRPQRVVDGEKYDRIDITYDVVTEWVTGDIPNTVMVTIFVPCNKKVAITNPLLAVLNAQLGTTATTVGCDFCGGPPVAFTVAEMTDETDGEESDVATTEEV